MTALPMESISNRGSPGPFSCSVVIVARTTWSQAVSTRPVDLAQMLYCSASCCFGVACRRGIVDHEIPA
jgi:hypothetical protein